MPLLVDAVNVLHVTGVLPPELAGPDETALAELVARSRWKDDWVRLVCDGGVPGEAHPFPSLDIVLIRTGSRAADDVIVALAEKSSFARRIIVVTNDRGLRARVRGFGCRSMSGEHFLERLATDAARRRSSPSFDARAPSRSDGPLNAESVEAWMRAFGLDDDDAKQKG